MNRKSLITGIAIAAAAFAASAESYEEYNKPFVSSAPRAVVQAEAAQRSAPAANPWSISYNPLAQFRSEKTRAEVTAEYIAQRDLVDAFMGEDSGSGYLAGRPAAAGETRLAARH
jgi:hypothetical protein